MPSINPFPGGHLSLRKVVSVVVCEWSYEGCEETESDLYFDHEYLMKMDDYRKGIKILKETGHCSIPIHKAKELYPCRLKPVPDAVNMEMQDDGTVFVFYKTPWSIDDISF